LKIEELKWDTDFFGYQICKVEIENFHVDQFEGLILYLNKSNVKLVYVYPLDNISTNTLKTFEIPVIDTKITFEKEGGFSLNALTSITSFVAIEKSEDLEKLALISGEYSRFKKDIKFSNHEYFRLYKEWIRKSISREIANDVLVYKKGCNILGFVSYSITKTSDIVIGLIAVDPKESGQGIGKLLMQAVENAAVQKNVNKIIVSTQLENIRALAFYQSCGFTKKKQQEIFHLWIQ
jgi:dTDP-4-amino-4,6-dideoxy-D-galactose acyltransferase